MGNVVSGVSARLQRLIKDESIFSELLVANQQNISIDMDPQHRVKDPYNSNYKLHLCDKIASNVILLFPHYDRNDLKIMYVYKYNRFHSLQRDINKRLKDAPDKDVAHAHKIFNQMVVCWGDYTYKLTGLDTGNVYLLWATQIRGATGSSKTKLYVTPDGEGVPVIVVTNGHYRPIAIFPVHPGELISKDRRGRPPLLDPAKSKMFWHEEAILFVLDKPYPKGTGPVIKKKTALQVRSTINEYANVSVEALEEDDDALLHESGSDEDQEGPHGAPPLVLVKGNVLSQNLTITYLGKEDTKQKGEEDEVEIEVY